MTSKKSDSGRIQSVETTLELLETLQDRQPAGVSEIAAALPRSKSTVHHYLKTLEDYDYVEREDDKYLLGIQFLALGGMARERERIFHLSRDDVDRLATETGEMARLIIERGWRGITVYEAEGNRVADGITHLGRTEPLHSTAAGKAFLAAVPDDQMQKYISETGLPPQTENTITDADELTAELDRISERGVAFDDQEQYDGIRCVAVPLVIDQDRVPGALSVSAPVDRMPEERFRSTLPDILQNIAGVVEINTTYSDWVASF